MGKEIIIVTVLILEMTGVLGLYIAQGKNDTSIYELKEDKDRNALTITIPKPDKPTLREIIYYHIIETPYDQEQNRKEDNNNIENNEQNAAENDVNEAYDTKKVVNEAIKQIIDNEHELPDSNEDMITGDENSTNDVNGEDSTNDVNGNSVNKVLELVDSQRHFTNGQGYQFFGADPEDQYDPRPEETIEQVRDSKVEQSRPDYVLLNRNEKKDIDKDLSADLTVPVDNKTNDLDDQTTTEDLNETTEKERDPTLDKKELEHQTARPEDASSNKRRKRSLMGEGKTYGMKLTGDKGVVWNDFNNVKVSFPVGTASNDIEVINFNNEQALRERREDDNDEKENGVTDKSENDLIETDSDKELNKQGVIKTSETPSFDTLPPSNQDSSFGDSDTDELLEPIIVESNTETPSTTKLLQPSIEDLKTTGKTYGMMLTGEHGTVWNDLNRRRISYHVGESIGRNEDSNDKDSKAKTNDDQEINAQIDEFENYLREVTSKADTKISEPPTTIIPVTEKSTAEEPDIEYPLTNEPVNEMTTTEKIDPLEPITEKLTTKKPTTEKPMTKKLPTEEPATQTSITEEPKKPAKTYGMSLAGDHGIVWNDLSGSRVSYHVGETNEEETTDKVPETTTKPDFNEILNNMLNPIENDKENATNTDISDFDADINMINEIFGPTEASKPINTDTVNEIIDIIKEVFKNETEKLEDKLKPCNNSNANGEGKDENSEEGKDKIDDNNAVSAENHNKNNTNVGNVIETGDNKGDKDETSQITENIQNVIGNDQFWQWLNEWSSSYMDLLMNKIDTRIKEEVAKQITEYFATPEHNTGISPPANNNEDNSDDCNEELVDLEGYKDNNDESPTKKRKDKDSDNKKEDPIKIQVNNVYGNSVGNGNVTNIFVFNIRNMTDLGNIKELNNGTNGVYVFGSDDTKPVEGNATVDLEENKDKNYEVNETTKKPTPKPVVIEEQPDQTTETPNEKPTTTIVTTTTTKTPETDVEEKPENESNEHIHEVEMTTEKATPTSNDVVENPTISVTTEIPKETMGFTTTPLDNENSKPEDESTTELPKTEDENNENKRKHNEVDEKPTTDIPNGSSTQNLEDETTPTLEPVTELTELNETTENPKELADITTKPKEKETEESRESEKRDEETKADEDKSDTDDAAPLDSKEVDKETNESSESNDNSTDAKENAEENTLNASSE